MTRQMGVGSLLLLGAVSVALAGGREPAYTTPQEALDAASKAMDRKDWKAFCGTLTDESRDEFAGGLMVMMAIDRAVSGVAAAFAPKDKRDEMLARFKAKRKAVDEVLAKHGLTEEAFKRMKPEGPESKGDPEDPKLMKKALKALVSPVKDRTALVVDLMTILVNGQKVKRGGEKDLFPPGARLEAVKIERDRARGVLVSGTGDRQKRQPLEFRRVSGGWRIEWPFGELFSKALRKAKAPPPPGSYGPFRRPEDRPDEPKLDPTGPTPEPAPPARSSRPDDRPDEPKLDPKTPRGQRPPPEE